MAGATIAAFNGITILLYPGDHNPPHVHAFYGGDEVLVEIAGAGVYAGRLPQRQLRLVQDYVLARTSDLLDGWGVAVEGQQYAGWIP